ncbi:MAG: sigma-70 family RNA polymerase sigma factor [Planctomycetes bacterium]|nr:sigma-70 family RNA polymerase sigma factor [Planctomycetota bacterium]
MDEALDGAVEPPDRFEPAVEELVEHLDRQDSDVEISDPHTWRRGTVAAKTSFVQQFRADVDAIIPLNRKDEGRLARRIEFARRRHDKAQGEAEANSRRMVRRATELHALRSEMVERNLYLVLINVERYAQIHASRLDLIQEGCVSLFRAVDGFDWRRGLLFRTYAVHWLNQAFRNYLYNNGHTVRVPVYLQKALKRIHQTAAALGDAHASPSAIAANSELEENLIVSALAAARTSYSLDAEHSDSSYSSRLRDLLVDSSSHEPYRPELEDVSLDGGLEKALDALGERERLVLRLRFGLGMDREFTLAEVAEQLGVSVERVRQIQVRALSKLDTPTLRRELEPFLN